MSKEYRFAEDPPEHNTVVFVVCLGQQSTLGRFAPEAGYEDDRGAGVWVDLEGNPLKTPHLWKDKEEG